MKLPEYINEDELRDWIRGWVAEDVGSGDVTTNATIDDAEATATFLAKEAGVVAGLEAAAVVFSEVDNLLQVTWRSEDGTRVEAGTEIGTVTGPAPAILVGERLALNLMQRMSGIATATSAMVAAARPHKARILDTRKTAPGLRRIDKWAVLLGGGENHRLGLFDMVLIKDNHIAAAGGIAAAVRRACAAVAHAKQPLRIEVEARTLHEVRVVAALEGVDVILLDNMVHLDGGRIDTTMLQQAVDLVGGRTETEASGNVTLETVQAIAATGVDYISSGSLTHSVRALDISLKIDLR